MKKYNSERDSIDQIHYVYIYYHPITSEPFLVGKGSYDRGNHAIDVEKIQNATNARCFRYIEDLRKQGLEPIIDRKYYDSEQEAYDTEDILIRHFGRLHLDPGGILMNYIFGGTGGHTGCKRSKETKEKIRQANLGKPCSESAKEKLRQQRKGVPLTQEHIDNQTAARIGSKHSEETKEKIRESNKLYSSIPENCSMYGRNHSEESKQLMSDVMSKKTWFFRDPQNNIIEFKNLNDFCRDNNLNRGQMRNVFEGKQYEHRGYKNIDASITKKPNSNTGTTRSQETLQKLSDSYSRKDSIYLLDSSNNKIEIRSVSMFCKTNNLPRTCINHLIGGKLQDYKGFRKAS